MKMRFLGIALILGLSSAAAFATETDTTEVKTEKAELFACPAHEKKDSTEIGKTDLFAQEVESDSTQTEVKFACEAKKDTTATPEKTDLFAQDTESESTEATTEEDLKKKAELIAQNDEDNSTEAKPEEGTEKANIFAQDTESESTEATTEEDLKKRAELIAQNDEDNSTETKVPGEDTEKANIFA